MRKAVPCRRVIDQAVELDRRVEFDWAAGEFILDNSRMEDHGLMLLAKLR